MTDPVFIHPVPLEATPGGEFNLSGPERKHAEVKRLRNGETIVISDGQGRAVRGQWYGAGRIAVTEIIDVASQQHARRPLVTVVQAIPKSERAELAVDLMVQAGADRIVPWAAARCVSRWDGKEAKARAKWQNAALAAAKQSRRLVVPDVGELLHSPGELGLPRLGTPGADYRRLIAILHEEASVPLSSLETALNEVDELVLVIGPEGGIAPEEITAFQELDMASHSSHSSAETLGGRSGTHTPGIGTQKQHTVETRVETVVLGPEVLRTATAAAVALGAVGSMTSRWR